MENTIKPQKRISQKIAEFMFTLYMITLYIFVDREETVMISKTVFVIFAVFTVIAVLRSKSIHIGKNVMAVYIAFTWMFATIFWAQNGHDATVMMKTMWQLFIQFFLAYNLFAKQSDAHDSLLRSLYISGLVLIGYSIYVYGLSDVISAMAGDGTVRFGAEINQENSFGMMNATTVLVAFYYFLYKRKFKIFHTVTVVVSFIFAMSSGSRKALLMILGGALIMVYKKYGWKKLYKIVAVVAILAVVFSSAMKLPIFETISSRMESATEVVTGEGQGDSSTRSRLNMIVGGLEVFKDRIVAGYGANNYKNVTRFKTYAHNNFIEILVNFGLFGFILYYLVYFYGFKNLWKTQNDAGKALFAIFIVRFVMELAMVTYYGKIHWVMMAFYLISIEKNLNENKSPEEYSGAENLVLEESVAVGEETIG